MIETSKIAYICGPWTNLEPWQQSQARKFYERIAAAYSSVTGKRSFLPHEQYSSEVYFNVTAREIDAIERNQIQKKTSVLIAVTLAPSWGGGIEVEMANQANVPVIILHKGDQKVSRLLRGNPAVKLVIPYKAEDQAITMLTEYFKKLHLRMALPNFDLGANI